VDENTGKKANPAMMIGIVAVVLIAGFVLYSIISGRSRNQNEQSADDNNDRTETKQESLQQEQPIQPLEPGQPFPNDTGKPEAEGTEGAGMRVINVEGENFSFIPNEIRVKVGEKVKVVFTSNDMTHDFVVDELNIRTPITQAGDTAEVEFSADTPGEYEFYCSVGQHRANGMFGTLIVEE